ncbi:preQ(1) synthase [Mucisphaera sp.]|uniref:preQ(1) synthase n=1 Tax=Mucisphaera sp. TaxID=2913024 RepID=UPI003D130C02
MADIKLLESFPNPSSNRDYLIEHVAEEFTSLCPKTGHPDFGVVSLRYVPDKTCVELKSLKMYLQAFRNEGIFYEAVTNKIADDLKNFMSPRWIELRTDWHGRGGIRSSITVESGNRPGMPDDDWYDEDEGRPLERPGDDNWR